MRTLGFGFAGVTAILCIASACSSTTDDCLETSTCASGGAAGTSGSAGKSGATGTGGNNGASGGHAGRAGASGNGGEAGSGDAAGNGGDSGAGGDLAPPCDTTLSPSADACLISNEYAIFVDPAGKESAAGTKGSPVNTLTKAIQLAGDEKIVIACNGTYDEQVKILGRARIYGGFACSGSAAPWTYEDGKRAKVAPTARGFALSIAAGAAEVDVEDVEFDAKDGADAGESSIAAFVKESTSVAFHRVKLVAGKGVNGADGARTDVVFPTQSELNGKVASTDDGGPPNTVACAAGGNTRGGRGGDGGGSASSGTAGLPDLGAGKGGTQGVDCGLGGAGISGADAPPQPASPGASKLGNITPTGWIGAPGTDGTPGIPGQGGGGGAGAGTGGGGGAGGCGGNGGTGGKSGGSSIALLTLNSTLTFDASEFVSANAGSGGKGFAGQGGQLESGKGGVQVPDGCSGGKGGKGGSGGAGGGAAGGISVGIAYQGAAPTPDAATTITVGTSGTKGLGGVPGTNDGIDGKAQNILEVP